MGIETQSAPIEAEPAFGSRAFTAARAAICTAPQGVGSHAEPPTMERAAPVA